MLKTFFVLAFCCLTQSVLGVDRICRLDEPCTVSYKTIGCYKDSFGQRMLPNYIYNERDSTNSNFGGRTIDWYNWESYMAGFSCRCANAARGLGYDVFGVQFYGECWAGHKSSDVYTALGASTKCIGDQYKPCGSNDRYCSGEQETNFVYEIFDTTCDIEFVREGCYSDTHNDNARPLANYVLNDRDSTDPSYSGQMIDWLNWDVYLPELACRCAKKAQQNGSVYFGLQYYGECWAHPQGIDTYYVDGKKDNCVDNCFEECNQQPICTGVQFSNYVYRIRGSCGVAIEPIGCYNENPSSRVLNTELSNAQDAESAVFYGEVPDTAPSAWVNFFPDFLCKCALAAKIKGHQYFGVSEYGVCYSDNTSENYGSLGSSSNCYQGADNVTCPSGSKMCAGKDANTNYVYQITLPQASSSSKKRTFIPARDPMREEDFEY